MIKCLILLFAVLIISTLALGQTRSNKSFSFTAIGDMPYFVPDDYARFENVIKKINKENSVLTIHVGDFKSSSMLCSDEYYTKMIQYFQSFNKPLIYTPGDNEWTDCNKKEAGSYDPNERLAIIRSMFFRGRKSFGKETILLESQSLNPLYGKYVENNRWEYNEVQFATIHAVGTNNNKIAEDNSRLKEFEERDVANVAWLEEAFKVATETGKIAIVISMQADMFSSTKGPIGFENIISKLTSLTINFQKPVLLINGDSHKFIIEKPLVRTKDPKINKSRVVENFTRLQLFGEQDMHAVKIIVHPDLPQVFEIEQLLVEGN